jgi:uncharacterized protein (TIGR03435 family)
VPDIRRARIPLIVTVTALAVRALVAQSTAQSAAPDQRFDVASVKPAQSPAEAGAEAGRLRAEGKPVPPAFFGSRPMPGGRYQADSSLKQIVAQAFDVKDYQIEGGPAWLSTDYFAINASAGRDATAAEMNAMLRTLLVERFKLRTHADTRQAPVYVLSLARSDGRLGGGLKPTPPDCLQQIEARKNGQASPSRPALSSGALPTTPTCGTSMTIGRSNGAMTLLYGGSELKSLLSTISSEVAAPVTDRTGLTGLFDIVLDFTSERSAGRPVGLDPNSNDTPPPPLGVALEKQLGLKLEKQIGPLPIVVIDGVDRPTAD